MKTLLENDFIVSHGFDPDYSAIASLNAKHGDIVPHKAKIYKVEIYQRIPGEYHDSFVKVELTRQDIIALKDALESIESQVKDLPYENHPF